jgi:DNA-binding LacI/PurR family transcriptional regulator
MQELLSQSNRPEAVFVASDTMASGALQALRDAGLSAPDDIAIFGFDGMEAELVSRPVLSTVFQPIHHFGRQAVKLLLERIASPDRPPIQQFLPTHLELRTSCGCGRQPLMSAEDMIEGGVPA